MTLVCDDRASERYQDPLYGQLRLEPFQRAIISTPHFFRLHQLKQMGSAYLIFTNANHTRFSHCVGVGHLARKMYRHLAGVERKTLEEMLVVTAAMCHDLGHGPHSHAFEMWCRDVANIEFDHEAMSAALVEDMFNKGYLDAFFGSCALDRNGRPHMLADKNQALARNCEIVKAMIVGVKGGTALRILPGHKQWLLEIVHNASCGIDVDKMDYLMRDMQAVYGTLHSHVQIDTIIDAARVVDGCVRYDESACNQLYEMLYLRASLHRNVYSHRDVIAVKYMYLDLLSEIDRNSNGRVRRLCTEPESFLQLNDFIFDCEYGKESPLRVRLAERNYYKQIGAHRSAQKLRINVSDVIEQLTTADLWRDDDLLVVTHRFDLGNGTSDCLAQSNVFFARHELGVCTQVSADPRCRSVFYTANAPTCEYLTLLFVRTDPEKIKDNKSLLQETAACFEKLCAQV